MLPKCDSFSESTTVCGDAVGMLQVTIEFSLLSEFLGSVLTTNQIAKDCTQDTLKKVPFS
jgi:hypothetical protein